MSEFKEFHKNNHSIAQLKELQVVRRLAFLEDQKVRREEQFSFLRDLKQIVPNIKLTKKQTKAEKYLQRECNGVPTQPKPRYNNSFRDILMLSEWMMATPEDLEEYLLIPCPKGSRVSVSVGDAPGKVTELYLKNGMHFMDIKTNLPPNTILDCIFSKSNNIIYILDILMYAGRDVVNCDTAFRRFWIKSKFMEDNIRCYDASMELKIAPDYDFSNPHSVYECFQRHPMFDDDTKLDGFLFYHKESSYTFGETPLVLWLFPFMIDEILTMFRVNKIYMNDRPLNYKNYLEYIKEFNAKQEKKKNKRKGGNKLKEKMEVEVSKPEPPTSDDVDFTQDDEMQKMIDLEKFGGDV